MLKNSDKRKEIKALNQISMKNMQISIFKLYYRKIYYKIYGTDKKELFNNWQEFVIFLQKTASYVQQILGRWGGGGCKSI